MSEPLFDLEKLIKQWLGLLGLLPSVETPAKEPEPEKIEPPKENIKYTVYCTKNGKEFRIENASLEDAQKYKGNQEAAGWTCTISPPASSTPTPTPQPKTPTPTPQPKTYPEYSPQSRTIGKHPMVEPL